eukprot:992260-Amorphochlora_amoeboformis.AAC.1
MGACDVDVEGDGVGFDNLRVFSMIVDVLLLDCGGFGMGSLFGVLGVPKKILRESRFALVSLIVLITLCPPFEANTCCVDIGEISIY